jgi:hypothetical protein
MTRIWDSVLWHKREALWAAVCAFIFGPLPHWVSSLYAKGKMAVADFDACLSTRSRLMTKIIRLQFERRRLTRYLESSSTLIADLFDQGMFTIGLIAIGLTLGYLFPLVRGPLGPWRLLPAVIDGVATFSAFDTARLARKKSPEDMRSEIAQIDRKLLALDSQLQSVDPIAATVMRHPSPF